MEKGLQRKFTEIEMFCNMVRFPPAGARIVVVEIEDEIEAIAERREIVDAIRKFRDESKQQWLIMEMAPSELSIRCIYELMEEMRPPRSVIFIGRSGDWDLWLEYLKSYDLFPVVDRSVFVEINASDVQR